MEEFIIKDGVLKRYNGKDKIVHIPEGVEHIEDLSYHNKFIEEVYMPESLRSIGDRVFSYFDNLKKVQLNKGLQNIGYHAFEDCRQLTDINIDETRARIKGDSFAFCTGLADVKEYICIKGILQPCVPMCRDHTLEIPETVKILDNDSFYIDDRRCYDKYGCITNFGKKIIIPASVEKIWRAGNEFTREIVSYSDAEFSWRCFDTCTSLIHLTIKKGTKIDKGAFLGNEETMKRVKLSFL